MARVGFDRLIPLPVALVLRPADWESRRESRRVLRDKGDLRPESREGLRCRAGARHRRGERPRRKDNEDESARYSPAV